MVRVHWPIGRSRVRTLLTVSVLVGALHGCGSDSASDAQTSCKLDRECGEGKICVNQVCIDTGGVTDAGGDARSDATGPDIGPEPDAGRDATSDPDTVSTDPDAADPDDTTPGDTTPGDADPGDTTTTDTSIDDAGDTTATDTADAGDAPDPGTYGAPCSRDTDCQSGRCIEGDDGRVCTIACSANEQCGEGWVCEPLRTDATQTFCWPEGPRLCSPCAADGECGGALDACVTIGEESSCGRLCRDRACPTGYECRSVRGSEGRQSQQCVPATNTCEGCVDADGDGFGVGAECLGPDCNDADENVHPGAAEVCDGQDNDCNGIVDGMTRSCYGGPAETEGVGTCEAGVATCVDGEFGSCEGEVVPSDEVCDGADNDCDGVVDGFEISCYSGTEGTAGVGACREGTRTCTDGSFGACTGEVTPTEEVCDGIDNDCDGAADGFNEACYTGPEGTDGVGVCGGGVRTCENGEFSSCSGETVPSVERCDQQDNDCDGVTDAFQETCYSGPADTAGVGLCASGTRICASGVFGVCEGEVLPADEVCDGEDNDCDGLSDGLQEACYEGPSGTAGIGQCVAGRRTCDDAVFGDCEGQMLPEAETCDGIDNDCDGTVDAFSAPCFDGPAEAAGVGLCRSGTAVCVDGAFGTCSGQVLPASEACDGEDNDCDGEVDEGCECLDGDQQDCYGGPAGTDGVGVCVAGFQNCIGGFWATCQGEVGPGEEVCDGLDNDCDGAADEGVTRTCYDGPSGTSGTGTCRAGTQACVEGSFSSTCDGQIIPADEVCDGLDNDCDGDADGFSTTCYTGPAGTAGVGTCRAGSSLCTDGEQGSCSGEVLPAAEICDGFDNDCDDTIDEGCDCVHGATRPCYTGPEGTAGVGVCAAGSQTCAAGAWGSCDGEVKPGEEVCDGADNDCDGGTDEGVTRTCYGGPTGTAGVGECRAGQQACVNGTFTGTCVGEVRPTSELCDDADNDCDGTIDSFASSCYEGPDGTLDRGLCAAGTRTCTDGVQGTCGGQTLPAEETCDGEDNDCDGTVDEGCNCIDGTQQACYTGPSGTAGRGLCRAGTQTCVEGEFTACVGEVTPVAELCDGEDNDCDGATDEGVTRACYEGPDGTSGVGACRAGAQACVDGAFGGACVGQVLPSAEICDNADNDCDGSTDGFSESCYGGPAGTAGVGVCREGTRVCTGGTAGICSGAVLPSTEICDGLDNDCDDTVDEGCDCIDGQTRSCYDGPTGTLGEGLCQGGTQTCAAGRWGTCAGQVLPADEVCDNEDNDCDGSTDEGVTRACYTGPDGTSGRGECRGGAQACVAGSFTGPCVGEVTPVSEICDNRDNNCDGAVDGFADSCYTGAAGTAGVGVCRSGSWTCSSGSFGACGGQVVPSTEICDGVDNDCDGTTDEGCDCINGQTRPCYDGANGTQGVGPCRGGTQTCVSGAWGSCAGQILPAVELCDNVDNDCDNAVDEGVTQACYEGPGGTAGVGVCRAGVRTCSAGTFTGTCTGQVLPSAEVCDNLDNDCNGSTDGFNESCYGGPVGTVGVGICRVGTRTCTSGSYGACNGEVLPAAAEICGNGLDDDCSGAAEDGCAPPISAASVVTTTSECLTRGTDAQTLITATLVDTTGAAVTGATVTMTATAGTMSSVTADGNVYWAILTAPASGTSTQVTVGASANGSSVTLSTRPTITISDALPNAGIAGGAAGCPVDGNVRVRVVRADTGAALSGARVMIGASENTAAYVGVPRQAAAAANTGLTDSSGYVRFVDFATNLEDPVTVTAGATGFTYTTFVGLDASDITIALTEQLPGGSRGTVSGDVTNVEGGSLLGGPSIGAALVVGSVYFRDIAAFSLDTLLAEASCYTAAGNTLAVPKNIFIPSQLFGQASKRPYTTAPLPYGSQRLSAISILNSIGTFTGDGGIAGALGNLSFRRVGYADVNVAAATQSSNVGLPNSNNLAARLNCAVTGAPAVSDTFCVAVGDYDSRVDTSIEPGEGRLFIMGLKALAASASGAASITGVTGVARSSTGYANIDYVVASLALYLDEARAGIPTGTANGLSAIFSRRVNATTEYNLGSGTTTATFSDYMPIRTLLRNGRTFSFAAPAGGRSAHYSELVIRRTVTEAYNTCPGETDDRETTYNLWRVYLPASASDVTLPTLPASWPQGGNAGDFNGLADPTTLTPSNSLDWRHTAYHEGDLGATFVWNRILIGRQPRTVTHLTSNSLGW